MKYPALNRLLTIALPAVTFGAFLVMFKNPYLLPSVAPLLLASLVVGLWQLAGRRWSARLGHFAATPLLLLTSLTLYVSFLLLGRLRVVLVAVVCWLLYVYLEHVHTYYAQPERYHSYVWINLTTYLNLLVVFLMAGGWYWLHLYLDVSLPAGAVAVAATASLLGYQQLAFGGGQHQGRVPLLLALTVSLGELFYVIGWFPTTPFFNATLVMLAYYVIVGLSRNQLLGTLGPRVIRRYAVIAVLSLVLVAATARWA